MSARIFILSLAAFLFSGCLDDVLEEYTRNKLVIWGDAPPEGRVGDPYLFRLGARVENTPYDNHYDFHFDLVDGSIPPGTRFEMYREDGVDYARVIGVPTEAGSFSFAVRVKSYDLEAEKESEREAERSDSISLTNTEDEDEGLYTIYILE